MRFRRKYVLLAFASVAAFAVTGIASANHGPGGQVCDQTHQSPNCANNGSSLPTWNVTPSSLPGSGGGGANGGSGSTANVALDVQTHTFYAHPGDAAQGGKVANVQLSFDNDVVLNLGGISQTCTPSTAFGAGTTLDAAWDECGPSGDNAYLSPGGGTSPAGTTSGTVSTAPPQNFAGCNLVFKRSATTVYLVARVSFAATADCSGPNGNTTGNTTTVLIGTVANNQTGDYKTKLTVPLPSTIPLALDDFKSKVARGNVFKARCQDTNKKLNLKGRFQYVGSQTEQPVDTVTKTKACT